MSTTSVNISAAQVKELRDKTNAPMMDCKNALTEAKGDVEGAIVILRKKGIATAAKKATRATSEGSVSSYIHAGGKIGVLVEVNCESDFVARTDDFKGLVHDIAMHIAATDPRFVRKEDVTPEAFEKEEDIYRAQAAATGKPAPVIEKIVEGKMAKFYEEVCLYEQPFIKDQTISVYQMIATVRLASWAKNISVRRFARFKVGDVGETIAISKAGMTPQRSKFFASTLRQGRDLLASPPPLFFARCETSRGRSDRLRLFHRLQKRRPKLLQLVRPDAFDRRQLIQ